MLGAAAGSEVAAVAPVLIGAAVAELELEAAGALLAFAGFASSGFGLSTCVEDIIDTLHMGHGW